MSYLLSSYFLNQTNQRTVKDRVNYPCNQKLNYFCLYYPLHVWIQSALRLCNWLEILYRVITCLYLLKTSESYFFCSMSNSADIIIGSLSPSAKHAYSKCSDNLLNSNSSRSSMDGRNLLRIPRVSSSEFLESTNAWTSSSCTLWPTHINSCASLYQYFSMSPS